MPESLFRGTVNRLLQIIARFSPGATTLRVKCHRLRGMTIGKGVWIGYDCILETSRPNLVTIGDGVSIGIRTTIIGHFKETKGVFIENDAFIGPGVIILPNVRIGRGAVVSAGSVVSLSVAPMIVVQGNPAKPIAKCGIPLTMKVSLKEFSSKLKRL